MTKVTIILAAAATLAFGAASALAQARVFVSGHGDDTNPCSLSAPCRSFQQAHDTAAAGGEIVALDAAGYGPLTITKAVTVTAIGIDASITSNSTTPTAITINAGASDVVAIRGLTLFVDANTSLADGIDIKSAKSVMIRDCSISGGFPGTGDGIAVEPSANLDVELRGVFVHNVGAQGLDIAPTGSGAVNVLVTDSFFTGNGGRGVEVNGVGSKGSITATLNVVAANNGFEGILVTSFGGGARTVAMVTNSKLINNTFGLEARAALYSTNLQVLVDRTQITGNTFGWGASVGAVVSSYQNNEVDGNGNDNLNGVTQITSE